MLGLAQTPSIKTKQKKVKIKCFILNGEFCSIIFYHLIFINIPLWKQKTCFLFHSKNSVLKSQAPALHTKSPSPSWTFTGKGLEGEEKQRLRFTSFLFAKSHLQYWLEKLFDFFIHKQCPLSLWSFVSLCVIARGTFIHLWVEA